MVGQIPIWVFSTVSLLALAFLFGFAKWLVGIPFLRRKPSSQWMALFEKSDKDSESELWDLLQATDPKALSVPERQDLGHVKTLIEFRALAFGRNLRGKRLLWATFLYHQELKLESTETKTEALPDWKVDSLQDIAEAATGVAALYWKVLHACHSTNPRVARAARRLFEATLGTHGVAKGAREQVEVLTDSMQREGGVPYLILNLLKKGHIAEAKGLGTRLLSGDFPIDEESRATLYWLAELEYFLSEEVTVRDFESTIRFLYHLCFLNPDRAGFLEIDSQFYSQFETVSDLAREGFLFKDSLIQQFLGLWREHRGLFDATFVRLLSQMTRQNEKAYDDLDSWEMYWERAQDEFEKEYLLVVEGNACFAAKDDKSAFNFYEKALLENSHNRAALLNRVFAAARLKDRKRFESSVKALVDMPSLYPLSLSVAGNASLLLGDSQMANRYYEELSQQEGWGHKTEYYRSTFCFEHGLFEDALRYAQIAVQKNPSDSSMSYHLSLCFNATGSKEEALAALRVVQGPQWMHYYRFTLERDAGRLGDAHQTLKEIPSEYFEDPEELEAALEFAKSAQDLSLLRRLRSRK